MAGPSRSTNAPMLRIADVFGGDAEVGSVTARFAAVGDMTRHIACRCEDTLGAAETTGRPEAARFAAAFRAVIGPIDAGAGHLVGASPPLDGTPLYRRICANAIAV